MQIFNNNYPCCTGDNQRVSSYRTSGQRQKRGLWFFRFLLLVLPLFFQGILFPQLESLYKSGTIKMVVDSSFGSQTDWENQFYDMYKSMTMAPDGSLFISNSRQHNITKISATGQVVKTFGQKGQGTSDVTSPHHLSILDQKYLVVGESPLLRRISLFKLDGKFSQIIRTNHECYFPQALKDSRIVYYSILSDNTNVKKYTVWIKDVITGIEIKVVSVELLTKDKLRPDKNTLIYIGNHWGELILKQTGDGNVLVGISNQPDINIYSPQGKWLRSFRLNITPLSVTSTYIRDYKQLILEDFASTRDGRPSLDIIKKASFSELIPSTLPYYRQIVVDSAGNILVFRWLDCVRGGMEKFLVYSATGNFINEVLLDTGQFEVEIDYRWENLLFTNSGIFAYVPLKNNEDSNPRIIKIKVPDKQ